MTLDDDWFVKVFIVVLFVVVVSSLLDNNLSVVVLSVVLVVVGGRSEHTVAGSIYWDVSTSSQVSTKLTYPSISFEYQEICHFNTCYSDFCYGLWPPFKAPMIVKGTLSRFLKRISK